MKIRSCPFCQGKSMYVDSVLIDGGEVFFLCCRQCQCEGPTADNEMDAIKLWDSRHRATESAEIIPVKGG